MKKKKLSPKERQYNQEVDSAITKICGWFEAPRNTREMIAAFTMINNIGREWRKHFSHKGIYKIARKHVLRHIAFQLSDAENIPDELALAIIYIGANRYLPESYRMAYLLEALVKKVNNPRIKFYRKDFSWTIIVY